MTQRTQIERAAPSLRHLRDLRLLLAESRAPSTHQIHAAVSRMRRLAFLLALSLGTAAAPAGAQPAPARTSAPREQVTFARLVATLSEPGGFFDTDNLISNERSYLHVVGALRAMGVRGGAYVGVGPDQSFSYIAHVRPSVAYVIDVRRDNMLQHLLFKALFARARNRAEYLALLLGRPVPADAARWGTRDVDAIVAHLDATPATAASAEAARAIVREGVRRTGVPLSADDLATVARFHGEFIAAGLGLQFTSTGRAPRPYYPTLRQLVLERDLEGRQASYLAREDDFQFVKRLQQRDLVVPVVGNLAGEHALAAIGRDMAARGTRLSALYTSNVEDYLMRDGSFPRFARTVAALPRMPNGVIVRSYFGRGGLSLPQTEPGHYSTQLLQTLASFAAEHASGGLRTYADVVTKGSIDLRRR